MAEMKPGPFEVMEPKRTRGRHLRRPRVVPDQCAPLGNETIRASD